MGDGWIPLINTVIVVMNDYSTCGAYKILKDFSSRLFGENLATTSGLPQTRQIGQRGQTGHTGKTGETKQLNLTFQETCAGQLSQFLRCFAMLCIFNPLFIFVVVLYRRDKMFGMQQRLGIIDCY